MKTDKLNLFWYSFYNFKPEPKLFSRHYIRRKFGVEKENYGDLLSKYLVEKITGSKTHWYNPQQDSPKKNYLAIGSILNFADDKSCIWGSGIINRKHEVTCEEIKAVRGPITQRRLQDLGYDCPSVYGDPALILPIYFNPKISKKYKIGIVPHWMDNQKVKQLFNESNDIKIINLITSNIEFTTKQILECEAIISSSLHGIIIAHAYNIPAIWVKFSDHLYGDDVKFSDYLESVNLQTYNGPYIFKTLNINELESLLVQEDNLPTEGHLEKLKQGLIKNCPF